MSEKSTQIAPVSSKRSALAHRSTEVLAKRGLHDLILPENAEKHSCLAAVSTADGWGFIDEKGNFIIEPKYSWAASYSDQRACFSYSEAAYHWRLISYSYRHCMRDADHLRFEFLYGHIFDRAKPGNVFGYLDPSGKEVIPPKFCCAEPFRQGLARVALNTGRGVGFIGVNGAFEIEPEFDEATNFNGEMSIVQKDEKYGVIDRHGRFVATPRFDYVWDFSEGLARARIGEKIGFIDTSGHFAIEPIFDGAWEFAEGLAPVEIDGNWGYIAADGHFSIYPIFSQASCFSGGTAEVDGWDSEAPFLINKDGDRIPSRYEQDVRLQSVSGLVRVYRAGLWGFANSSGEIVIPAAFQDAAEFSNGLARVANEQGLWGYINARGDIVIPMQFLNSRDFVDVD